ncbi:MAG: sirohydrochlorin cobaltochelatase [Eubacteriales bacterium]|nr:sirohydrochlorin cobaltochelatase [Eubacteriales bacterium]
MSEKKTKGILVVSFGTSYDLTREATIDVIEADIARTFPDFQVYRAWTSQMIIQKLKKRDHVQIDTVCEAMERMAADGITDVVVQPTHVVNGHENDQMKEDALSYAHLFSSLSIGDPLLTTEEDNETVVRTIAQEFSHLRPQEDALVLMGHGTTHYANAIYAALDYRFKDMDFPHIFLGTVEAYPGIEAVLRQVQEYGPRQVVLAPFMIVAGDHATNDMAGDDPQSWLFQFRQAGFSVCPVLKGLGEYQGIRDLLISHVREAMNGLDQIP